MQLFFFQSSVFFFSYEHNSKEKYHATYNLFPRRINATSTHITDDKEFNIVMDFNRRYIHFTFPAKIKLFFFNPCQHIITLFLTDYLFCI